MCTNDCICDAGAATTYANIDWTLFSNLSRSANSIVTASTGTVDTYQNCIKNAPEPTDST